jgi:hypothetical protein
MHACAVLWGVQGCGELIVSLGHCTHCVQLHYCQQTSNSVKWFDRRMQLLCSQVMAADGPSNGLPEGAHAQMKVNSVGTGKRLHGPHAHGC